MDEYLDNFLVLDKFNVSRETLSVLDEFRELIIEKNKEINLISRRSIKNSRNRHILDCAQAIDFIDINSKTCTDIGSGAGLPGSVTRMPVPKKQRLPRTAESVRQLLSRAGPVRGHHQVLHAILRDVQFVINPPRVTRWGWYGRK